MALGWTAEDRQIALVLQTEAEEALKMDFKQPPAGKIFLSGSFAAPFKYHDAGHWVASYPSLAEQAVLEEEQAGLWEFCSGTL